jgi:hypothetical protein
MTTDFAFNLADWRAALLPRTDTPPTPPDGAHYRIAVDPAFFAEDGSDGNNRSDESALTVGFLGEDSSMTLTDSRAGLWKGIGLPEEIVDAIGTWNPEVVLIERSGNGAPDLLADNIRFLCDMRETGTPRIEFFTPHNSKPCRIRRLQDLLDNNLLRIHQGVFVSDLFAQVESFCFDRQDNKGREDGRLDSLASLCGYR